MRGGALGRVAGVDHHGWPAAGDDISLLDRGGQRIRRRRTRRRADVHDWASTPQIVSTGGASVISQNTATITGTIDPQGLQTNYGFEIGTEPGNYGPPSGGGSIGAGTTEEAVSLALQDLQPGTTYYYKLIATNVDGTSYGQDETFTTPGFPSQLMQPATPPLLAIPAIAFPKEEKGSTGTSTKTLTNKQKLAKALKACGKKPKSKRAGCERLARRKYGAVKKRTRA